MPKTIEAIYEDGVFKPLKKIRLNEHQHPSYVWASRQSQP